MLTPVKRAAVSHMMLNEEFALKLRLIFTTTLLATSINGAFAAVPDLFSAAPQPPAARHTQAMRAVDNGS